MRRRLADQEHIEVSFDGDVPVVALPGEWDLSRRELLASGLAELSVGRTKQVVLDLSRTTFIDSTVINLLVEAHRAGLRFTIRGAGAEPRHVLEVLDLPHVFEIG